MTAALLVYRHTYIISLIMKFVNNDIVLLLLFVLLLLGHLVLARLLCYYSLL